MKKLSAVLFAAALSTTLFVGCDSQKEQVNPNVETTVSSQRTIGPYEVNFAGRTVSGGNTTFNYSVERVGPAKGNGLSHMIFSLGNCVSFESIVGAAIDGVPHTALFTTEGSGTGCIIPTGATFVKFDNVPGIVSSGVHMFSLTVAGEIGAVAEEGSIWVKAGPNCYSAGSMIVPGGCPVGEGCSMSHGFYFSSPVGVGSWSEGSVEIAGQEYTHAEAQAIGNVQNGGGALNISSAKLAFMQVASIKLSNANVSPTASVRAQVALAEAALAPYGKITPATLPYNPNFGVAGATAAGAIGAWISANHCE